MSACSNPEGYATRRIRAEQSPKRLRIRSRRKPLAELARGRRDAVVVISDKTRPIPYGIVLPPILSAIEAGGVPRERIEILVATGLHRANTPDELAAMTSPDIVARYRIRNHVARDAAQHVHLGRTGARDGAVDRPRLRRRRPQGRHRPDRAAPDGGLLRRPQGGGAGLRRRGHDAQPARRGDARSGDRPGADRRQPVPRRVGRHRAARRRRLHVRRHHRPCAPADRRVRRRSRSGARGGRPRGGAHVRAEIDAPADVVITSAAGFPLDDTYYQSIKGMVASLNVVRRGGTIILAAAITEGIGSAEFQRLLAETRDARRLHGAHHRPRLLHRGPVDAAASLPGPPQSRGDRREPRPRRRSRRPICSPPSPQPSRTRWRAAAPATARARTSP